MIDANGLKTCKITNGALKGEMLPRRLKFFAWGDNKSTDGNFRAGDRTSSELPANQKKYGFERVAIDFNHCSVPGTDTYKDLLKVGQPPLIFGYGRVEAVPNDGIYLEDIIWTPLGVQHARNFEDLSPAIQDEDGEVTLVHSVALTPNGKVEGLEFFTATQAVLENQAAPPTELAEKKLTLLSVAQMLNLPETAEEKEVLEKLKNVLCLALSKPNTEAGEITALSARIQILEEHFKKTADGGQEAERSRMVTLLSAEGKSPKREDGAAYSRDELLALDVPTLKLLHANTPATVPLSARGMTSQIDGQGRFVSKDSQGNMRVDLAGIFDSENQRNGQAMPKLA
ncbi:MAG TPA: phage protease [Pseudomonadales bacterium]|nr:phage protease [Pseudomonadales bacterium]